MSQGTRLLAGLRLTSVQRGLVQDQSVLNVIAAVAHHGHGGVLSSRQLLKLDNLDGFGFHHGPLRIGQQVHQSVDAVPLVVANGAWREGNQPERVQRRLNLGPFYSGWSPSRGRGK